MAGANTKTESAPFTERLSNQFHINRTATFIVLVMAIVQAIGIRFVTAVIEFDGFESSTQTTELMDLGQFALIGVVEITAILGLWIGYKRLSDYWQRLVRLTVKTLVYGSLVCLGVYTTHSNGELIETLALTGVLSPIVFLFKIYDLNWILHNLFAIMLGGVAVTGMAIVFSPMLALILLVGTLILDYYAVNLSNIMARLIEFSTASKLPNYLVIPSRLQMDLAEARNWTGSSPDDRGEKPPGLDGVIGLGDFVFPSLLPLSVIVTLDGTLMSSPVIGSIIGIFVSIPVLAAAANGSKGLPALPWLNTGSLCGFVAGAAVSSIPLMTLLGF